MGGWLYNSLKVPQVILLSSRSPVQICYWLMVNIQLKTSGIFKLKLRVFYILRKKKKSSEMGLNRKPHRCINSNKNILTTYDVLHFSTRATSDGTILSSPWRKTTWLSEKPCLLLNWSDTVLFTQKIF